MWVRNAPTSPPPQLARRPPPALGRVLHQELVQRRRRRRERVPACRRVHDVRDALELAQIDGDDRLNLMQSACGKERSRSSRIGSGIAWVLCNGPARRDGPCDSSVVGAGPAIERRSLRPALQLVIRYVYDHGSTSECLESGTVSAIHHSFGGWSRGGSEAPGVLVAFTERALHYRLSGG